MILQGKDTIPSCLMLEKFITAEQGEDSFSLTMQRDKILRDKPPQD